MNLRSLIILCIIGITSELTIKCSLTLSSLKPGEKYNPQTTVYGTKFYQETYIQTNAEQEAKKRPEWKNKQSEAIVN